MEPTLKQRFFDWYNVRIKIGFYKAWTYILNSLMLLVGVLPNIIDIVLNNWASVGVAVPTIEPATLLVIYMSLNVINLFLAPVKQAPGSLKIADPAETATAPAQPTRVWNEADD